MNDVLWCVQDRAIWTWSLARLNMRYRQGKAITLKGM